MSFHKAELLCHWLLTSRTQFFFGISMTSQRKFIYATWCKIRKRCSFSKGLRRQNVRRIKPRNHSGELASFVLKRFSSSLSISKSCFSSLWRMDVRHSGYDIYFALIQNSFNISVNFSASCLFAYIWDTMTLLHNTSGFGYRVLSPGIIYFYIYSF